MDIKTWTLNHIKQKNSMLGQNPEIKEEENKIKCGYKEKNVIYNCDENLSLEQIKSIDEKIENYLVCLCNEHNFKLLIDNWNLFKTKPKLTFIFVSPQMDDKFVVKPHIHAKIADPATLKQGLRTMYDTCIGVSS
jgi:hypothetical protein